MSGNQCSRCDGCGQIADDNEGTPWTHWAELPPPSNLSVVMGIVRPLPCPECGGSGIVGRSGGKAIMSTPPTDRGQALYEALVRQESPGPAFVDPPWDDLDDGQRGFFRMIAACVCPPDHLVVPRAALVACLDAAADVVDADDWEAAFNGRLNAAITRLDETARSLRAALCARS